jgi:uncharacterized integral membrane protein
MRIVALFLMVVLLASLGTYAILNVDERVDVALPWNDLRGIPQIYLVLTALAAGAIFMGVLSTADGIRLRIANRRLQRERDLLRDEVPVPAAPAAAEMPARRGPFRGGSGSPATRPAIPSAGSSSSSDDIPPYGV